MIETEDTPVHTQQMIVHVASHITATFFFHLLDRVRAVNISKLISADRTHTH